MHAYIPKVGFPTDDREPVHFRGLMMTGTTTPLLDEGRKEDTPTDTPTTIKYPHTADHNEGVGLGEGPIV